MTVTTLQYVLVATESLFPLLHHVLHQAPTLTVVYLLGNLHSAYVYCV